MFRRKFFSNEGIEYSYYQWVKPEKKLSLSALLSEWMILPLISSLFFLFLLFRFVFLFLLFWFFTMRKGGRKKKKNFNSTQEPKGRRKKKNHKLRIGKRITIKKFKIGHVWISSYTYGLSLYAYGLSSYAYGVT